VGKPEVFAYGSFYLTGYRSTRPLAALRTDLAALGLARDERPLETEDHIAFVLEVMRFLIAGDDIAVCNLEQQRRFFRQHLQPWVGQLCDTTAAHPRAQVWRAVAGFTARLHRGRDPGLRPAGDLNGADPRRADHRPDPGRRPRQPHGRRRQGPAEPPGLPLAMHALLRLQPQVGGADDQRQPQPGAYESMGVPVWPDALADYPGPLAGFLAGLEHCRRPTWSPCPATRRTFPTDLVARLAAALVAQDAEIAMAATRRRRPAAAQPVFCLMRRHADGKPGGLHCRPAQRKIDRWTGQHRCATVVFDDAAAFFNANTLDELQRLQPR
jgi:molybdopterin-guanine dinucleotide biosynthesis protein A